MKKHHQTQKPFLESSSTNFEGLAPQGLPVMITGLLADILQVTEQGFSLELAEPKPIEPPPAHYAEYMKRMQSETLDYVWTLQGETEVTHQGPLLKCACGKFTFDCPFAGFAATDATRGSTEW